MKTFVLSIENFMKIEKARIPLRGVIGLVGKNAQGKTSVLKAIQDVLMGQNDCTKIRDGAEKAVVSITATDENTGEELFSISRTQTQEAAKLQAKGLKNGQTPAGVLGVLFDEVAINPVRLLENGPVQYLKKHLKAAWDIGDMPADLRPFYAKEPGEALTADGFAFVEKEAEAIELERKMMARDIKQQEALVEAARRALPEELPAPPYSSEELHREETELRAAKENAKVINTQYNERLNVVRTAEFQVEQAQKKRDQEAQALADLREQLAQQEEWLKGAEEVLAKRQEELHQAWAKRDEVKPVDIAETDRALVELGKKLAAMKNHQVIVNQFAALKEQNTKLRELRENHECEDRLFKYFRYEAPKQLIEKCALGVPGIEFRDGEMFVEGRHISKMSTAERAIVATKLAISIAKQKGQIAICLDGVENLDEDHMEEFIKAAESAEVAVLYTRCGTPKFPCEVGIENGAIQTAAVQ